MRSSILLIAISVLASNALADGPDAHDSKKARTEITPYEEVKAQWGIHGVESITVVDEGDHGHYSFESWFSSMSRVLYFRCVSSKDPKKDFMGYVVTFPSAKNQNKQPSPIFSGITLNDSPHAVLLLDRNREVDTKVEMDKWMSDAKYGEEFKDTVEKLLPYFPNLNDPAVKKIASKNKPLMDRIRNLEAVEAVQTSSALGISAGGPNQWVDFTQLKNWPKNKGQGPYSFGTYLDKDQKKAFVTAKLLPDKDGGVFLVEYRPGPEAEDVYCGVFPSMLKKVSN